MPAVREGRRDVYRVQGGAQRRQRRPRKRAFPFAKGAFGFGRKARGCFVLRPLRFLRRGGRRQKARASRRQKSPSDAAELSAALSADTQKAALILFFHGQKRRAEPEIGRKNNC